MSGFRPIADIHQADILRCMNKAMAEVLIMAFVLISMGWLWGQAPWPLALCANLASTHRLLDQRAPLEESGVGDDRLVSTHC
jgi:hypothetical protein